MHTHYFTEIEKSKSNIYMSDYQMYMRLLTCTITYLIPKPIWRNVLILVLHTEEKKPHVIRVL